MPCYRHYQNHTVVSLRNWFPVPDCCNTVLASRPKSQPFCLLVLDKETMRRGHCVEVGRVYFSILKDLYIEWQSARE